MSESSVPAGPRRQERGERRIAAILSAAASLFAERGVDGTTMSEIAAQSKTAIGSLYQFFPNREAIVDALAEQYLADWQRMRADIAGSRANQTLNESIDVAIDRLVKFHIEHAALSRLFENMSETAHSIRELQGELDAAIEFLSHYGPQVPAERRLLYAQFLNAMVFGVMSAIIHRNLSDSERKKLVAELKSAMQGYLQERLS